MFFLILSDMALRQSRLFMNGFNSSTSEYLEHAASRRTIKRWLDIQLDTSFPHYYELPIFLVADVAAHPHQEQQTAELGTRAGLVLDLMSRHSKNNTSSSVFTYYERKKIKGIEDPKQCPMSRFLRRIRNTESSFWRWQFTQIRGLLALLTSSG